MAPRVVSWSDREICISPVLSNAASIISFDSQFSAPVPNHSLMSPTTCEAQGVPCDKCGIGYSKLPRSPYEGRTPTDGHSTLDDSFVRHDTYYFKDGNVTFLIDGTLYCVHRYFFSHHSTYFSTRFTQLRIRDHEVLPIVISMGDVKRNDFEALLSVLYPQNFEAHELTYEQWKSVLDLSTRWGFASLRKLAIKSIRPPTDHDKLVLARTYSVEQWVLPALTALCSRAPPLGLDEARQMDIEDVILVASVREDIRGGALQVDAADIPQYIAMAQPNNRLVSEAYRSTGKESGSMTDHASKLVNVSTPDLIDGGSKINSASVHIPAESGESELPAISEELPTEKLEDIPSKGPLFGERVTLTGIPVAAHVATTAVPTTARESHDGGGCNKDDGRDSGRKVVHGPLAYRSNTLAPLTAEDILGVPVMTRTIKKGGAIASTPPVPCADRCEDDWGIPLRTKKKKSGTSANMPATPCSGWGGTDWAAPVKKKKGSASASASAPVEVPGAIGGWY